MSYRCQLGLAGPLCHLKFVSLLIFCLVDLSIDVSEVLKSPTIIVLLLISPFISQSVQSLSHVRLFATPWAAARQASLSITNSQSPPKPMSIESVMPSSHLILCHPLLLLPTIPASIRVFSRESTQHEVAKVLEFQLHMSPSNKHPGLISFRMDWLDLLAVLGTLKSLFQHHSSKASIFQHSAFFIAQLSTHTSPLEKP